MASNRIPCPSEADEQKWLFQWMNDMRFKWPELELAHAIPNGGSRNKIEAHNLKLQGVKPGIPDVCIPVPRGGYHGLYIEMKRQHGGVLSEFQKEKIQMLRGQGYKVEVCEGFQKAANTIEEYMKGDPT